MSHPALALSHPPELSLGWKVVPPLLLHIGTSKENVPPFFDCPTPGGQASRKVVRGGGTLRVGRGTYLTPTREEGEREESSERVVGEGGLGVGIYSEKGGVPERAGRRTDPARKMLPKIIAQSFVAQNYCSQLTQSHCSCPSLHKSQIG